MLLSMLSPWGSRDHPSMLSSYLSSFFDDDNGFETARKTMPAVNVSETDKAYIMEVALPGMTKEDINIHIDENVLVIEGEKEEKDVKEEKDYSRREFNYRSFRRAFSLPEDVNQDKINAKYEEGILNLTIPKKQEGKTKTSKSIDIK